MIGEAEIIIGTEQQHLPAVEDDPGSLRALYGAQGPQHPLRAQLFQLACPILHSTLPHGDAAQVTDFIDEKGSALEKFDHGAQIAPVPFEKKRPSAPLLAQRL